MFISAENKKILIKKSDLAKLGLIVSTAEDLNYKNSLKPYEVMRYFSLEAAIAFLLGVHPRDQNLTNYNNYYPTEEALLKAIEKGELPDSKIINWGDWNNAAEAKIDRVSLETWAKYYGYKWVLPPYKPFNPNSMPTEQENATIDELKQQLAEAKVEIEKLKTTPKEYEGALPPRTDADKLAHFIDLLLEASPWLQRKDGKKPTYSELHTILSYKFPNERIPSKATIGKYMGIA